jgi:hypothetical protein
MILMLGLALAGVTGGVGHGSPGWDVAERDADGELAVLLAEALVSAEVQSTPQFIIHTTADAEITQQVAAWLDEVLADYAAWLDGLGLESSASDDQPLTVLLLGEYEQFALLRDAAGLHDGAQGFYAPGSEFVVLYDMRTHPQLAAPLNRPDRDPATRTEAWTQGGAPQLRRVVRHEAVHLLQAAHGIVPADQPPLWLAEGMAVLLEESAGADIPMSIGPVRQAEFARRYSEPGDLPNLRALLRTNRRWQPSRHQPLAGAVVAWLTAEHPDALGRLLRAYREAAREFDGLDFLEARGAVVSAAAKRRIFEYGTGTAGTAASASALHGGGDAVDTREQRGPQGGLLGLRGVPESADELDLDQVEDVGRGVAGGD